MTLAAIDLFSGGGGLTVGLKRAAYKVVSAVEIDRAAFSTYKANHPEVNAYRQDIRTVSGAALVERAPDRLIDLLAGCPPCQGFTSLTSKYRRQDDRNTLVLEMGRLVREIRPRAVMMENVPGLADKGKPLFDELISELESLGYIVNWNVLQVADYGAAQSRRRLVLLAGHGFEIPLPKPTHHRTGANGLKPWKMLRDVIHEMPSPVTLSESRRSGGPRAHDWHVVRDLSDLNKQRLAAVIPGESRTSLPDHLRPECHKGTYKGFSNVYGRMAWEQIPVTMTAGFTTPSKGRFGHPEEIRTISVREGAAIQGFDPGYIFDTDYMEEVCNIIGNALPCDFAEIVSRACHEATMRHEASLVAAS